MLFVVLLPLAFAQVFQQTYTQQNLTLSYMLNQEEQYLVIMKILEFPSQENLLPYLNVNNIIDYQAFSTRSIYHQLIVNNTQTIIIEIGQSIVSGIPQSNDNQSMVFQLTIISSQTQSLQCIFPYYDINCSKQIDSYEIDVLYLFKVKPKSWQFLYFNLSNSELELTIKNGPQIFGVAVLIKNQPYYTQLPSFTSQYQNIQPNQEIQIRIKDQSVSQITEDINNYVFIIGIYNFNLTSTEQLQLSMANTQQSIDFPIWAISLIIAIIGFGLILAVAIWYQIQKKEQKITPKPKIDEQILEKYMPILHQAIQQNQIIEDNEVCSICLDQFIRKSKIRITPCEHLFHNQCLIDWTFKQVNCPVCRQSFEEQDLEQFAKNKADKEQYQPNQANTPKFIQFSSTTRITSKRNERIERLNDSIHMEEYAIV